MQMNTQKSKAFTKRALSPRNRLIRRIQTGVRKLFSDPDDIREWKRNNSALNNRPGCESCADMTQMQLQQLEETLLKQGALESRRWQPPKERNRMLKKIEAQLADLQLPWSYADTMVFNIGGCRLDAPKRVRFVHDPRILRGVIANLEKMQKKRQSSQEPDA
jgi:hypothetical protein